MNLALSEEQELLAQGLRGLLEGSGDIERMRRIAYEGDGRDPELWEELFKNGWSSAAVPEAAGGLGLGFEEAMVIAIEQGAVVDGTRVAFEDDVLVTQDGYDWLSRFIPIEIDEVETLRREQPVIRPETFLEILP